MTRTGSWLVAAAALIAAAFGTSGTAAQDAAEDAMPTVTVGYVELADDPRYRKDSAYAGIVYRTLGRPYPGARLGIEDAQTLGRIIKRDFALERASADSVEALHEPVADWAQHRDIHFVIADLPAAALLHLADAVENLPVLLMNVSAREETLRGHDCRANVVHVIPSESMLTDALVQYLVAKNWTRFLVLQGPTKDDVRYVEAIQRSAAKFGAEVVEVRPFALGNDPRRRTENNIALATGGVEADIVLVADASGELARYVPYQTAKPTPVAGDAGLMPKAWHWSWYRHGAPQLQHRFEEIAAPRRMNSEAWAAWAAVKAVTQAAMRARSGTFTSMRDFILSGKLNLDGVKGNPMSVRPWDHQVRQPILLTTADAVIARAPLPEYLHRSNVLDTLGADAPESECRM